ncbi:Heavy metal-associated domain, HMA [Artemisia annua]|uniref:Heavy metal-associated domain, HMA n=1 Tax=Artemisia annua TaxID=35608 RepID=A0A2U1KMB5_ARTAN|nr:Heavy metal-associated domain, HMA [Artemisia annua]
MPKKIELKVNMHSQACKTKVLKAVTKVIGIDEVSADLEKQMLIVIGDVDPVCIVARVRKIGKIAEIVSVGPPKKPDPPKPNPEPCKDLCQIIYPNPWPVSNDVYGPVMKIEVKVNMHCEKCKTEVLKAVTKLSGINEVSVDLEKQMLVVIGDVDPVCVVKRVRKTGKIAEMNDVVLPGGSVHIDVGVAIIHLFPTLLRWSVKYEDLVYA